MGLSKGAAVFYTFAFGCVLVFGIALLSVHTVFTQMIEARGVRIPVDQPVENTHCTLVNVHIEEVGLGWNAEWNNGKVITSPLGLRRDYAQAERDAAAWPFNVSYPCTCFGTTVCMLETGVVQYLQQEAARYGYAEATLIGIGIMSLLFSIFGLTVLLWDTGCFWRCGGENKKMGDFHIMVESDSGIDKN